MAGINYIFDATQHTPEQTSGPHPVGKFPATIAHTEIKSTKDQGGGMFVVTFSTDCGSILMRYNLWNNSQKAVDIAHKQLSALCHAVGIFKVDMNNEGVSLRNARCMIEVAKQAPESEYVEVKHVYCVDGSEPGKAVAVAHQPQPAPQPVQQAPQPQNGPAWGNGAGQATPAYTPAPAQSAQPSAPSWGPAPQQAAAPQVWQQPQQAPAATPPWATR